MSTVKPKAKSAPAKPAKNLPIRVVPEAGGRLKYIATALKNEAALSPAVRELQDIMIRTMEVPENGSDPVALLRHAFDEALPKMRKHRADPNALWALVRRSFLGYGRIDLLMQDPGIEEITCDGPNIPLFVYHRQHGAMETNIVFEDEDELDSFVIRMAQMCNREITFARPMLEGTLPDNSRLQASLSREITTRGSSFTIRKFLPDPLTPVDLIQRGTMDAKMAAFLWLAIESKQSVLFVGGTASGKTTGLNACCAFIPPNEKIVSIEDTRELALPQLNWTAGVTRSEVTEDAQTIDMYKLLATALRQRPDYILVGEVRGQEAVTMFQAMSTGHATMSTMHADSPLTAIRRLENPPIGVPRNLIESLGLVVMHRRAPEAGASARRMFEISEVSGIDPGTGDLLMRVIFRWDPKTDEHEYLGKSRIMNSLPGGQKEWERRTNQLDQLSKDKRKDIKTLMASLEN